VDDSASRTVDALFAAAKLAAPPPDLDIAAWAERDRVLGHSSRLSGPYKCAVTPFWRAPMEDLSPRSPVQTVIVQKGAQMGASEFALNVIGFYLSISPAPILYSTTTSQNAQRFSRQRLSEMIGLSPALAELMATPRGGERTNSVLTKATANGALLMLTGSNSPAALRSLPIRVLILDEVDGYPGDVGGEGDPVDLAVQRTESYGTQKKILAISTPTHKDASRIESLYGASDRRRYHLPCPACGNFIVLDFAQLYLDAGEALYRCQICNGAISERDKLGMLEAGEWRATAPAGDPTVRGYHVSQMLSPWTSWADLLKRDAAAQGYPERQRVFSNCALGETWGPPALAVPEADVLIARAEAHVEGTVPQGGAFLTAGCDVQADRIEIEVVAWGRDFESWSIGYFVLGGDITQPDVWNQLDALLAREWKHVSGMPMTLQAVCVDAGFAPSEVLRFTHSRHGRRIYGTKGLSSAFGKAIWPRKAIYERNRLPLYLVSTDEAKLFTMNRLRIEQPGAGYLHTPLSRPRDWYEQLVIEKLVVIKGQRRWVNPTRARNEATDARALAVCALHSRLLAGLDLNRWCEEFEKALRPPVNGTPAAPTQPSTIRSRFVWG
jgi:phage terminase large subunit GpA-like protein